MNSYIDPKNQTLLWNTIHKHPSIYVVFPNDPYSNNIKNNWFKNIISQIYSNLPSTISKETLLEKNKETLSVMNQDLKNRMNTTNIQNIQNEPIYSRNQKDNSINNDFQQRQKEYELMMKKPVVEEISFKENSNDGVIKNMDELIQQQLREREQDLQRISKTYESIQIPPKLNIKENIPEKELTVVDLPIMETEKIEKKSVSWGSSSIIEYNHLLETKLDELNKKYDELFDYLKSCIPNFVSNFSNRKIIKNILDENIQKIEIKK
jgi:hypothetical protein